jgi:hypothetical protein
MNREDQQSAAFFDILCSDLNARQWFFERIGAPTDGTINPCSKSSQWRYSSVQGQWWETDIYILIDRPDRSRFAVHIENKINAGFTPNQVQNYALRAEEWSLRETEEYADWVTVLMAPKAYLNRNSEQASGFDVMVSHEEICLEIPAFSLPESDVVPESESNIETAPILTQTEQLIDVFFAFARMAPTRLRTEPIGTTGGIQIREFTIDHFDIRKGHNNGVPGYWVLMYPEELKKRGIDHSEVIVRAERTE